MGVGRLLPRWKLPRPCLLFDGVPFVALDRVFIEGDVEASASRPSS